MSLAHILTHQENRARSDAGGPNVATTFERKTVLEVLKGFRETHFSFMIRTQPEDVDQFLCQGNVPANWIEEGRVEERRNFIIAVSQM